MKTLQPYSKSMSRCSGMLWCAVLLLGALVQGNASPGAWDEDEIVFPGDGRPSQVKVYPRGHEDGGTAIPAIVITERAKVRRGPGFNYDAKDLPDSFLFPFFVLAENARGTKTWFLVGTLPDTSDRRVKEVYGWMMEDDLLFQKRAVKKEGIYSKGLIITSWRNNSGPGGALEPAPVMRGPGANFDRLGAGLGLFNFYFIFKELVIGSDRWYLLGANPVIANSARPGEVLLGWVHYARVSRWDTRLAVEINKNNLPQRTKRVRPDLLATGKGGVKIFDSRRDLDRHLEGQDVEAVAEEDTQKKSNSHEELRFPVTDILKGFGGAGRVYKIGFIGDQFDEEGTKIADSNTTFKNTTKLQQLIGDLEGIDLVFLIDATGTMEKYKDAINAAVSKIGTELKQRFDHRSAVDPKLRFSIVLYRDYQNEGKPGDYLVKRLPLTDDLDEIRLFVERSNTRPGGGDAHEAFLYGIDYAVKTTLEDESASQADMRLLVHITDAGNAPNDARGLTAQSVAKTLLDADFDYYCINTSPAVFPGSAAEDLERQVEIIRASIPETDADVRYFPKTEADEIVRAIEDSAVRVADELNRTKAAAKAVAMEGNLIEAKNRYGVRVTQRLTKKMKAYGIDPTIFRKKGVQVFAEGYVSRDDDRRRIQDQVKEVYLVARPDLARLEGFLADFQLEGDDIDGLTGVWTKVLKQAVGESQFNTSKPVIDLMRAHASLSPNSKILRYSLDQLQVMDADQRSRLYWDLRADQSRLYGLMSERDIAVHLNLDALPGSKLKVVEKAGQRRIWSTRNDTQYGWIPIVELP